MVFYKPMKKYSFIIMLVVIISLFIIASCGSLLDSYNLLGTWTLSNVEFYVYNSNLDSIKTYTSTSNAEPDDEHPSIREFFNDKDMTGDEEYTIEFEDTDEELIIKKGDSVIIVDGPNGSWSVDSFENSISIKIKQDGTSDNFWKKGFSFKNYWPLANYSTLELTIKAEDIGKSKFSVDLTNDTLDVDVMKGIFTK